jgi:hypothetical protein
VKLTTGIISPAFYEQLFCTKVKIRAFLYWKFGFILFGQIEMAGKAALKMLVKFTTGRYL